MKRTLEDFYFLPPAYAEIILRMPELMQMRFANGIYHAWRLKLSTGEPAFNFPENPKNLSRAFLMRVRWIGRKGVDAFIEAIGGLDGEILVKSEKKQMRPTKERLAEIRRETRTREHDQLFTRDEYEELLAEIDALESEKRSNRTEDGIEIARLGGELAALRNERDRLCERVEKLTALEQWLAATPTRQDFTYCPINQHQAWVALRALAEDDEAAK